jgi:ribosomal-protein-alanine N-acetyltransferase
MMSIRRARGEDLRSILRIEKMSFARDAWDRDIFLDYLARSGTLFLAATIDHAVVGYIVASLGDTRAEVDSIAVAPAKRGRGIASALLQRVVGVLRRRGLKTVCLNVRIENQAAIRLYRKLGFRRVRRVHGYYDDGASAWRMRKSG